MRRAWPIVLLLGACLPDYSLSTLDSSDTLDECGSAPAGRSCVTLHLHNDVGTIDTVQVDAQFELGGNEVVRRAISQGPTRGAKTPIAVGVILSPNAGSYVTFTVVARLGVTPAGIGSAVVYSLLPGQHGAVDVRLTAAAQSRCFDHTIDGSERDTDCGGGECPACLLGQHCLTDTDCADSSCQPPASGSNWTCQ